MKRLINRLPWSVLIVFCLLLGLAPFTSQPHLVEKMQILIQGELTRTIDIFDLLYHSTPFVLLLLKLIFRYKENRL